MVKMLVNDTNHRNGEVVIADRHRTQQHLVFSGAKFGATRCICHYQRLLLLPKGMPDEDPLNRAGARSGLIAVRRFG